MKLQPTLLPPLLVPWLLDPSRKTPWQPRLRLLLPAPVPVPESRSSPWEHSFANGLVEPCTWDLMFG